MSRLQTLKENLAAKINAGSIRMLTVKRNYPMTVRANQSARLSDRIKIHCSREEDGLEGHTQSLRIIMHMALEKVLCVDYL